MTSRQQVELFLRALHEKIRYMDVAFRPRDKNLETLAELEITPVKRIEYLMSLTVEDYYSGPNRDNYDPTRPDYFEFGIQIKGREVYIKVSPGLTGRRVDCMSFHIAEFPINYLFKNNC